MNKAKIKKFITGKIGIGIISFILGVMLASPNSKYVKNITNEKYDGLIRTEEEYKKTLSQNKDLQAKVDEAKPFFDMNKEEQTTMANEAKAKQEERLKKEKQEADDKKKADLEAKTKTLSNGNFEAGKDFQSGTYDIVAVSGNGNVSSSNMYSGGINAIMGVGNEYCGDLYQKEYKNIKLPTGTTLKVKDVTIKLVPVE